MWHIARILIRELSEEEVVGNLGMAGHAFLELADNGRDLFEGFELFHVMASALYSIASVDKLSHHFKYLEKP